MSISNAYCTSSYWGRGNVSCACVDQPQDVIGEDCSTFFSTGQSSYSIPARPVRDSSFFHCKDDEHSFLPSEAKPSSKSDLAEDSFSTASTLSGAGCADRSDRVYTDEDDSTWTALESCGPTTASENTLQLENDAHIPPGDDFDLYLTSCYDDEKMCLSSDISTTTVLNDILWESPLPQDYSSMGQIEDTKDVVEQFVDRVVNIKPDIMARGDPPLLEGMPSALSPVVSPETRVIDLKAITICNNVPESPAVTITRTNRGGSQSSSASSVCLRPEPRPSRSASSPTQTKPRLHRRLSTRRKRSGSSIGSTVATAKQFKEEMNGFGNSGRNKRIQVATLKDEIALALGKRLQLDLGTDFCSISQSLRLRAQQSAMAFFLNMRGCSCVDYSAWKDIVTPNCIVVSPLPLHANASDVQCSPEGTVTLKGLDAIVKDCHAAKFAETMNQRSKQLRSSPLSLPYSTLADEAIINGVRAFCCWTLRIDGLGIPYSMDGMLHCDFSDDGLIQTAEIVYDAMILSVRLAQVGVLPICSARAGIVFHGELPVTLTATNVQQHHQPR